MPNDKTVVTSEKPTKQRVVVIGGGFGGIKAAIEIADDNAFEVTLVSDQSNFRYYPTLYHAATGGTTVASSIPLSEIVSGRAIRFAQDNITTIDRVAKTAIGSSGATYAYDVLILSLGVVTNYFGIAGIKDYSYGIKSLEEARKLRDHLHQQLVDTHLPDLNYVVIGGGPTGVELAGALPSYISHILKKHGIKGSKINVALVEAAPRLLPHMPPEFSAKVQAQLEKLGVKMYLGKAVEAETDEALMVGGESLKSRTVIWTAGVTNSPFFKTNKFNMTLHGKVVVDSFLQAEPNIYVIGDNAATEFSGMAQTAVYDGLFLAENLKRLAHGKSAISYTPKRPIYVTPAGPHWAGVLWGSHKVYGLIGWCLRRAADAIAFHDLEPWWTARKHILADSGSEENCPICKHHSAT